MPQRAEARMRSAPSQRTIGAVHPKAMPVILTQSDEIEAWMTAPWETAKALQRPLPDGALSVIDT